jgi:hypothetical protein
MMLDMRDHLSSCGQMMLSFRAQDFHSHQQAGG